MLPDLSNFLYNPLIFDIFLNLICPHTSKYSITEHQQLEIWKKLYSHKIFLELSLSMLRGSEIPTKRSSVLDLSPEKITLIYEKNKKNIMNIEEYSKFSLDSVIGPRIGVMDFQNLVFYRIIRK